jgi:hypothetical protein
MRITRCTSTEWTRHSLVARNTRPRRSDVSLPQYTANTRLLVGGNGLPALYTDDEKKNDSKSASGVNNGLGWRGGE